MSSSEQNTGLKLLKNTLWILQVITLIYSAINLAESSSDYVRSTNLDTLWSSKSLNKVEKSIMNYKSINVVERVSRYKGIDFPVQKIVKILPRNKSLISRIKHLQAMQLQLISSTSVIILKIHQYIF